MKQVIDKLNVTNKKVNDAKSLYEKNGALPDSDKYLKDYLELLVSSNPQQAMKVIHSGWQTNKFPFNDTTVKLFFTSAAKANRMKDVNVMGLMTFYDRYSLKIFH